MKMKILLVLILSLNLQLCLDMDSICCNDYEKNLRLEKGMFVVELTAPSNQFDDCIYSINITSNSAFDLFIIKNSSYNKFITDGNVELCEFYQNNTKTLSNYQIWISFDSVKIIMENDDNLGNVNYTHPINIHITIKSQQSITLS